MGAGVWPVGTTVPVRRRTFVNKILLSALFAQQVKPRSRCIVCFWAIPHRGSCNSFGHLTTVLFSVMESLE